jgi:hypothetical protein
MIESNELKQKMDEIMKLMKSSSGNFNNIKPGNLESLIQALENDEENEIVNTLSGLHEVLERINEQATQLMLDNSYKPVENRYEKKPKKVR